MSTTQSFLWFCLIFVVWLILDCYIEDDGAMKSNAFFCLKEKQGVSHLEASYYMKLEPHVKRL